MKGKIKKNYLLKDRLKILYKQECLLIWVFILAFLIRCIYLNQIISTPILQGLALDSNQYDNLAIQILNGNFTHKDFIFINPFYPFFLAAIYFVFGHSSISVVFIQGVIDSISCVLLYFISTRIFDKKVGVIAAVIYAFYGIAIFYTGVLPSTTVVIFLSLLFICCLIVSVRKESLISFFISGILLGLAVLARPNILLFIFLLPFWFFNTIRKKLWTSKSIWGFSLLLSGLLIILSLITIRNSLIEKRFTPFSVQGGMNFYLGNNPSAKGQLTGSNRISNSPITQTKSSIAYAEKELGKRLTPSQASYYWFIKGLKFIKNNPSDALLLLAKKFALFWRKEEVASNIDYTLAKTFAPIFKFPFIPNNA